jgi:hypothetical protein
MTAELKFKTRRFLLSAFFVSSLALAATNSGPEALVITHISAQSSLVRHMVVLGNPVRGDLCIEWQTHPVDSPFCFEAARRHVGRLAGWRTRRAASKQKGEYQRLRSSIHRSPLTGFPFGPGAPLPRGIAAPGNGFSLSSVFDLRVITNPEALPALRPPRAEIPPSFWELHSSLVVCLGALLLCAVAVGIWLLCRPKPAAVVPPKVQAQHELEPLRSQPEDGVLLSRVSQVLRHYVAAAFGLPPAELTTSEFCHTLEGLEPVGPELSAAFSDFLRRCDERKFAPSPPQPPLGAVAQASRLIELTEARRTAAAQLASAPAPGTDPAANTPGAPE